MPDDVMIKLLEVRGPPNNDCYAIFIVERRMYFV
jgi:hypothetical protein